MSVPLESCRRERLSLPTCPPHWGRCRPAEPSPPSGRWCWRGTSPRLSWWWWPPSVATSGGTGRNCPHDPGWPRHLQLPARGKLKHGEINFYTEMFVQPSQPFPLKYTCFYFKYFKFLKVYIDRNKKFYYELQSWIFRYLFSELKPFIMDLDLLETQVRNIMKTNKKLFIIIAIVFVCFFGHFVTFLW